MRWWWPWAELRRLRLENDDLRATIAHQGQVINTLRRVLAWLGHDVTIDD